MQILMQDRNFMPSIKCQKFPVIDIRSSSSVDSKFQFRQCWFLRLEKINPLQIWAQFEMHRCVRPRLSRTIQLLLLRQHLAEETLDENVSHFSSTELSTPKEKELIMSRSFPWLSFQQPNFSSCQRERKRELMRMSPTWKLKFFLSLVLDTLAFPHAKERERELMMSPSFPRLSFQQRVFLDWARVVLSSKAESFCNWIIFTINHKPFHSVFKFFVASILFSSARRFAIWHFLVSRREKLINIPQCGHSPPPPQLPLLDFLSR